MLLHLSCCWHSLSSVSSFLPLGSLQNMKMKKIIQIFFLVWEGFRRLPPSTSNKLMMFYNTQSPTKISVRPEWTSLHDCTSWPFCPQDGLCFSSTSSPYINQHSTTVKFFACWPLTLFFWANFFPTQTLLHTTLPPSYTINLPTLLTYLLAYTLNPTN
jgi:hypothetical protein